MLKSIIAIGLTSALLVPASVIASEPAYEAKMKLNFQKDPSCLLQGYKDKSKPVKGRSSLVHDENTISWTTSCLIQLPKTVKYCTLTSQMVTNPEVLVSWNSVYQKEVLQAKIVSDADINPGFGTLTVTYVCFE
ncbi:hypothetical protein FLL45_14945 [Aliikangiella marina]|uniref:DUF3019 domain-containing protein n=1 Tax=Aliikangiella marina TaxID=1712262 RepID=A0A545T6A4_9GAMM|nr:hypothetical protein [Aliikangiella marina]TQV72767.1 hypothetical protein FLL45_14945 [Aliikangiella marina]